MARRSSRGNTPGGSGSASARIVDLTTYRRQSTWRNARNVYYLNESGTFSESLSHLHGVRVLDIRSLESLAARLLTRRPDLVLVESSVSWADALSLARQLEALHGAPVVLLCGGAESFNATWLKEAYASGASDTLFDPSADELTETIDVLLKMQWASSQSG